MDTSEIKETIKDASTYLNHLQNLCTELNCAKQQIEVTATEAENNINLLFSDLLSAITSALDYRRNELINKIKIIQEIGLIPLTESQKVVFNNVQCTETLVALGEDILKSENKSTRELKDFTKRSRLLGSLPEVPELKEVPYISFRHDPIAKKNLLHICSNIGTVIHIPPVQISSLTEKPGAIFVEWAISESYEHIKDIQEYQLQKAFGKRSGINFRTCYSGSDMQCLVKGLCLNQDYIFRVCCKFEGETEWSPWSVTQFGKTTLEPFCWNNNQNFIITNDNKTAIPIKNKSSILFSDKINFNTGYSVEFTFLEYDSNDLNNTFVGLFTTNSKGLSFTNLDSIYVETNGNIFESGLKKSTQFMPITKGAKICFSCDFKDRHKLRINIDCSGKRVTYDWLIDNKSIYLGAIFNSNKWKIMID